MIKNPNLRIAHVLKEVAFLKNLAATLDFESFVKDETVLKAVAYSLQIISEAVRFAPDEMLAKVPGVEWSKVSAT